MISVLLIDDHEVVRAGYRALLEVNTDISVVGEASNIEDGYKECLRHKPDVIVLDVSMPGESGFSLVQRLKASGIKSAILMLSMYDDSSYVKRAINLGADGYISKSDGVDSFTLAIRKLASGEGWLSPDIAHRAIAGSWGTKKNYKELTDREFEIFVLLARGKKVIEISKLLHISPKTVGAYQTKVFEKLEMSTTAELARLAIRQGFIDP